MPSSPSLIRRTRIRSFVALLLIVASAAVSHADPPATLEVSEGRRSGDEVRHDVRSTLQSKPTKLHLLLPQDLPEKPATVYLLPVEAGDAHRYGDPLAEAKRCKLHNRFGVIVATMTFAELPWYADHPQRKDRQQERYLLQLVDWIDRAYAPKSDRQRRLLVGFSKSGWGAWSLLLRHPDTFGRAAAWDAPMMLAAPGKYGSGPIFGDAENFSRYQLTRLMNRLQVDATTRKERESAAAGVPRVAAELNGQPRLSLLGYGNFREEHQQMHTLLTSAGVPHRYADGPRRKHDWHSGWLEEAVRSVVARR